MRLRLLHVSLIAFLAALPLVAQTAPVKPMAADAHPSFAVATIKPHDPNSNRQGINNEGNRIIIRNQSVAYLMIFGYAIHPRQIAGAPDWVLHDRWDIDGRADAEGEPSLHQQQEMVQKLLAERFGLKLHREKREMPVYAIQIVKGGPKLKPPANPAAEPDQQGNGHGTEQTITYTSASMQDFILGEQFFVDRPIVDQTGLTGRYDFSFRYTWDENHTTDPNAPPGLFTAVQEELGLKFEPAKAPVEVFVVDTVQKPTEN